MVKQYLNDRKEQVGRDSNQLYYASTSMLLRYYFNTKLIKRLNIYLSSFRFIVYVLIHLILNIL